MRERVGGVEGEVGWKGGEFGRERNKLSEPGGGKRGEGGERKSQQRITLLYVSKGVRE